MEVPKHQSDEIFGLRPCVSISSDTISFMDFSEKSGIDYGKVVEWMSVNVNSFPLLTVRSEKMALRQILNFFGISARDFAGYIRSGVAIPDTVKVTLRKSAYAFFVQKQEGGRLVLSERGRNFFQRKKITELMWDKFWITVSVTDEAFVRRETGELEESEREVKDNEWAGIAAGIRENMVPRFLRAGATLSQRAYNDLSFVKKLSLAVSGAAGSDSARRDLPEEMKRKLRTASGQAKCSEILKNYETYLAYVVGKKTVDRLDNSFFGASVLIPRKGIKWPGLAEWQVANAHFARAPKVVRRQRSLMEMLGEGGTASAAVAPTNAAPARRAVAIAAPPVAPASVPNRNAFGNFFEDESKTVAVDTQTPPSGTNTPDLHQTEDQSGAGSSGLQLMLNAPNADGKSRLSDTQVQNTDMRSGSSSVFSQSEMDGQHRLLKEKKKRQKMQEELELSQSEMAKMIQHVAQMNAEIRKLKAQRGGGIPGEGSGSRGESPGSGLVRLNPKNNPNSESLLFSMKGVRSPEKGNGEEVKDRESEEGTTDEAPAVVVSQNRDVDAEASSDQPIVNKVGAYTGVRVDTTSGAEDVAPEPAGDGSAGSS